MLVNALNYKKIKLRGVVKYVYKKMGKAILDYDMLQEKDKLLVAVSGGKDSLSLLKLLAMRKARAPIKFDFMACFVFTDFIKIDEKVLIDYFEESNIPFIIKKLKFDDTDMNCFWCSWNRRKVLFQTAKEQGCNKIALGHHIDDITETILMNLFFFGEISAMKPKIELFDNRINIIRPLCYVTKKDLNNFAIKLKLPVTSYECFHGKDSRRELVKNVIRTVEKDCSYVKKNIFGALRNLKKEYLI